jgi:hypothetical protein
MLLSLPAHVGVHEKHGHGRRRHHADHHYGPHHEHECELYCLPRHLRWRHDAKRQAVLGSGSRLDVAALKVAMSFLVRRSVPNT